MDQELVSRRNTLKYLSLLAGSEAGRSFLSGWLPGRGNYPEAATGSMQQGSAAKLTENRNSVPRYVPRFFKPEEFRTVEILAEMIIPTDEKPGAREAGVANYIDFVVYSAGEFQPELQQVWIAGLKLLEKISRKEYGRAFTELAPAQREALLTAMSLPERSREASHPGFSFYRVVKEMTVEGFYTSRMGLLDVLEYKGLTYLSSFPGCTHPEHH